MSSGKPVSIIDPQLINATYATVAKKVNVNSINLSYNTNYDHLNDIHESRDDSVTDNVYDTTNFEQRNDRRSPADSMYDISGGHSKYRDESVGLYDRVNSTMYKEYDTTDGLNSNCNETYDHI
ncbi:hypothetical protein ACJMK2_022183 [Sinanodonta woodiana]|uniref:Uncharacterized protein n=1 Tax=Sinanodonta woodiana TaxID=1069815 RepID=A0ABD3TI92_SINWO